MTRNQFVRTIVRYSSSRAICMATVPELFHSSGRALRVDELTRMPKSWLVGLLTKCIFVVNDFCEQIGEPFEPANEELVESMHIFLDKNFCEPVTGQSCLLTSDYPSSPSDDVISKEIISQLLDIPPERYKDG